MRKFFRIAAVVLVLELLASISIITPALAAATSINVTPNPAQVGATVTVSGNSASGDVITVAFDGTTIATPTAVGTAWTSSFTVPSVVAGSHTITANPGSQSATLTVMSKILLSRTTGTAGNSVIVSGAGYAANSAVTVSFNNVNIASGLSDVNGSFNITFAVPTIPTGNYNVTATDANFNTSTAVFANTLTPVITINKTTGPVGTSVTVNGSGFSASETGVKVTMGGNQVGSTTTASASGAWTAAFAVPAMPAGTYAIAASGSVTAATAVTALSFTVNPAFSLGNVKGPNGATITANGTGFGASEKVALTFDGAAVGNPVTADANGSWTATFNIPATASGAHTVLATGPTTVLPASAAINVTVTPNITTSKANGPAGTVITVTGAGFAANETGIVITFDGNSNGTPTTADANGGWTGSLTVPISSGGLHAISAKGATTALATVPSVSYATQATISSNKPGGTAGTTLIISGAGFAANETGIIILYDDTQIATGTIQADATGSWSQSIVIPTSSAGTHTIKAKGIITPLVSAGNTNFKVNSSFTLNPTTPAYVGMTLTISGAGFASDSVLTFLYDGNPLASAQSITDSAGNFSQTVTVPASAGGNHTIKITDASGDTYSQNFTMESTPPSIPNPTSPADGTKLGLTGDITPEFKWTAVTDQSGVTYNFEIDTDSAFPHPLLEKTGLTATHYTLIQTEALTKGQYFWRVQAVDGASNASAWSEPMTLNAGIISSGSLTWLIVLGVIVILALIYFVLIAPAMRRKKLVATPAAAAAPAPTVAAVPEIVIPEMVNAEYRALDADDPAKRKALPWRLALPAPAQAAKGKQFSPEEQARLKVAIDFAKALPLLESGNTTNWLVELAENDGENAPSPELYAHLLKGDIQAQYQPAWMRHPTFNDLQDLLEGQPVLQDLNSYVDAVNRTAAEATALLQSIYKDTTEALGGDILENNGWGFISGVYADATGWFLGKYLREPSERDYTIKQENGVYALYGAANTPFEGMLVRAPGETEAAQMRAAHLKLRRAYRNNDRSKQLASLLTQIDVQRSRLLNTFSQLSKLNT